MALTKPVKKVAKRKASPEHPDAGARPKLMTVADVAAYLGVSPHTVYREIQYEIHPVGLGQPGKRKILRFDPIDVYVYVERQKR